MSEVLSHSRPEATTSLTRLNQSMEYALRNLVKHGSFGPGVEIGIILALEERGLIWVPDLFDLSKCEVEEAGRAYYGAWLRGEGQ